MGGCPCTSEQLPLPPALPPQCGHPGGNNYRDWGHKVTEEIANLPLAANLEEQARPEREELAELPNTEPKVRAGNLAQPALYKPRKRQQTHL